MRPGFGCWTRLRPDRRHRKGRAVPLKRLDGKDTRLKEWLITEKQVAEIRTAYERLCTASNEIVGRALETGLSAHGPIDKYTSAEFDLGRLLDELDLDGGE